MCSASVLDRMNSLLEENGTLFITERGVIDGSIVSIKAHENFRYKYFSADIFEKIGVLFQFLCGLSTTFFILNYYQIIYKYK